MKLSIITINYNNAKGLENTIKSVLSQTFKDFEYIIIDGGSTDGSKEVIENLANTPSLRERAGERLYWCSEPDKGIYNAMNKGIAQAKGEYLNFMNSGDTFASPKSLELAAKHQWDTDVIMCDVFFYTQYSRWYDYVQAPDILSIQRMLKYGLFHQSSFIKRSLFAGGGYDESYKIVSDWAFWFDQLIISNKTYKHIPIPISIFEGGGISADNQSALWAERKKHLAQYISMQMLDRILLDLEWEKEVEYQRIINGERTILKKTIRFIDKNYKRLILPIVKRYMNKKYINQIWLEK